MGDLPIGMLIFLIFVIFSGYISFWIFWAWVVRQDKKFLKQFIENFKGENPNDRKTELKVIRGFPLTKYYVIEASGSYKGFPYIFNCNLSSAVGGYIYFNMKAPITSSMNFEITKKHLLADGFKILGNEENQPKVQLFLSSTENSKMIRELFDKNISSITAKNERLSVGSTLVQPIGWTFTSTPVLEFQSSVRLYFYEILDLLIELSQEVSKIS